MINVNVSAGNTGEYYNLIEVKQRIDQLQEEISGDTGVNIVVEPSSVTDLEADSNTIYVWDNAPEMLSILLKNPTDVGKPDYAFVFEAGDDFQIDMTALEDHPIVLAEDSNIIIGYNRVNVTFLNGSYYVNIINYRE